MKQNLLEPMLESLTRDEKVQLLQLILKDVGNNTSGIESQQGRSMRGECLYYPHSNSCMAIGSSKRAGFK